MRAIHVIGTLLLGCASGPANTIAPGNEGAPGVKRFLVCAPNTVIALPAELQNVTGALREQIDGYLRLQGREAQWIDLYDSRRLWTEAMRAAKERGGIEKTPVVFAEQLDERYDFDAIVMPSILLHKTRANMGSAEWDGVSRQMQIIHAPARPADHARSTLAEGVAYGGVSGEVLVTSVHVLVLSRDGAKVFEGRGGIGFVHDADMSPIKKRFSWELRMRDLAKDVDALREGIAIAFDPYLPPPEE